MRVAKPKAGPGPAADLVSQFATSETEQFVRWPVADGDRL